MPTMTQTDRIAQLKRVFVNSMLWGEGIPQHGNAVSPLWGGGGHALVDTKA